MECASETSYVEPLESQSQSEDENEACDGSEYLSEAHNMSHDPVAANKDANIEYEKQGDSILYIESVNQNKTTKKSLNEMCLMSHLICIGYLITIVARNLIKQVP